MPNTFTWSDKNSPLRILFKKGLSNSLSNGIISKISHKNSTIIFVKGSYESLESLEGKTRKGLFHSMSSSCEISTKEIWAAFFRQTFQADSEWFWAAFPTATVQVNTENIKPDILSLIFSSWDSLYAKNENYQTLIFETIIKYLKKNSSKALKHQIYLLLSVFFQQ